MILLAALFILLFGFGAFIAFALKVAALGFLLVVVAILLLLVSVSHFLVKGH